MSTWERQGGCVSTQLETSSVAVFLNGPTSPRSKKDCEVLVRRGCAIVPAILPTTPKQFKMPELLGRFNPVDFRQLDPDPVDRLVNGISEIWRPGSTDPNLPHSDSSRAL